MATDLIRYDLLVQDAMRSVMRKILADVAHDGRLPGDHHFTISFCTHAPGVKISKRLAEQWPHELTIILQHQFADLAVDERGFGVTLYFRGIPDHLYVPFGAVTGFFDPSVNFGLKFEILEEAHEPAPAPKAKPRLAAVPSEPPPGKSEAASPAKSEKKEEAAGDGKETKIISIDAFRKK